MSRRSRRRRTTAPSATTQKSHFLNRSLTPSLLRDMASSAHLRMVEDRRLHHPLEFFRPARTVDGGPAGPVTVKTPKNKPRPFLAHGLKFAPSKKVAICVRRNQRKEVLHALKKVGRGKGHGRKRRNWYSNIGC